MSSMTPGLSKCERSEGIGNWTPGDGRIWSSICQPSLLLATSNWKGGEILKSIFNCEMLLFKHSTEINIRELEGNYANSDTQVATTKSIVCFFYFNRLKIL